MKKSEHRQTHTNWMIVMFVVLVLSVVGLAFMGKVTSEFNLALGAILGYMGSHTYQNYRTNPKEDEDVQK